MSSASPAGGRERVTVVIPAKDAARLLERCLVSIAWADEIIVVDMNSTDDTEAVCASHPQCRLFRRDDYIEANVNYGFEQAACEWIMRLDTDEVVTPELAAEIQRILAAPPAGVTGFSFWERPIVLGRELRHGFGRRHYRPMLFRRGTARYPAQRYHEGFETAGRWIRGEHGYLHYNYASVDEYLRKMSFYTTGDVDRAELPAAAPSLRRGLIEAARAFYMWYLKFQGFRDGWVGLVDASMRSVYQFVYWAKLRERWEREHA